MITEEEKREAKRITQAKWRANNKEAIREINAKYRAENEYKYNKEYHAKYRAEKKTHFVVYKHTNSKGNVYIGCGTNLRPYEFYNRQRSKAWHESFDNECEVTILTRYKDIESARELETHLIQTIGLDNLVNTRA